MTPTPPAKVQARTIATICGFAVLAALLARCGGAGEEKPILTGNGAEAAVTATATEGSTPVPSPTPAPTSTPQPTATPTPPPAGSSRETPAPIGIPLEVGGWVITVNGVVPDGNEAVRVANMFNPSPEPGHQFFIASISATYQGGEESAMLFSDVTLRAVGASAVSYTTYGNYCGVVPDALDDLREVFKGGTISGNICWQVASADAPSLLMYGEESFSLQPKRAWWKLAD